MFSIEELASKLFISSSNLNRKVQHLFGFSTARLVRDLRLQHAAELLSTQNKSVTEAASLAGFFDVAHLSRYFKQNFGCSPGEYRNVSVFFSCIDKLKEEVISQIAK
nr:helix-turn-helix transcriptional regulator [Flavobacterium sp. ZT3R18]